ncbi:MAG: TlpA disulfide reductase family protein [Planctomycetaceae bacterium]|nr:TlpA disulfide reductase family protein [Planctomycetaceae bacterium]
MTTNWGLKFAGSLALGLTIAGCGQGPASTVNGTSGTDSSATNGAETGLPTAAIPNPQATSLPAEPEAQPPAEGTPEWALLEIQKVRLQPFPAVESDDQDPDDDVKNVSLSNSGTSDKPALDYNEDPAAEEKREKRAVVLGQIRALRRERNLQVVQLATDAIRLTAKDPAQEPVFLAAVQHLLDARLQLALQGDEESINALYEAANAFYAKRPDSPAAAEAQITVVNFAHASSLRYAKSEPRWLQEFSRQAQLYATRFGDDTSRAVPLLMAAGRSCEVNGLTDEAKSCFALIQSKYPESPQARQSAGVLRRMSLVGKPLELAGPTLDGNHLSIEDFAGKTTIVVFWSSTATPFVEQVSQLQAITEKYKKYAGVLSISLDSEESDIDTFREKTGLPWPVIFHVEHDQRSWNAPLAKYYGVSTLPTIWIVDPKGIVAETQVTAADLEAKLREVVMKNRPQTTSKAQPTGNN